jgi:hypothetical protein
MKLSVSCLMTTLSSWTRMRLLGVFHQGRQQYTRPFVFCERLNSDRTTSKPGMSGLNVTGGKSGTLPWAMVLPSAPR